MIKPRKSSVKSKVMKVIMLASITMLLVMVIAFMVYDLVTFRQTVQQNLEIQARLIAGNSREALATRNQTEAANVLATLKSEPHIIVAILYDAEGKIFVKYPAQMSTNNLPDKPQGWSHRFENSSLALFQPVIHSGRHLGTLYLRSDVTAISHRLQLYAAFSVLIMIGSLLVALWLSNILQKHISNPISALSEMARSISGQQDFSVRAKKFSDDELGDLTEAFNTMLNQIQTLLLELEKSRAHLQLVTDYASVLLCHVDRNQVFHFVNPAYATRFHTTPQAIVGRTVRDVVGLAAYESFSHYMEQVLAGERVEFEKEIPYDPLGKRWMHCIFAPERDLKGEVIGFVGVINDVTERKHAEMSSRQLAAIVEFSDDAIISKDLNGLITSWNRGAETLFGYRAEEAIGQPITILIPPERADEEPTILNRIGHGEHIEHYETIRQRKDGSVFEISLTISPLRDRNGKITGASKIARDISRQKQSERELGRAHAEVLAALRAKDDFLAALSHELRTPLNPVLLLASAAAEDSQLPDEVRKQFATIRNNVELEARLIDDLLDLTKITRGKLSLEMQPQDVRTLLKGAIAIVQDDADKKQIALTLDFKAEQHIIAGDSVRLQQIFWNVLKNAVKFTPEGGRITIETCTLPENGNVAVHIIDTGIGLKEAEITHIFDAFSQGDHTIKGSSHRFGGLGLGLTISRMLVELHSGHIHAVSSGLDQGATFIIDFPCIQSDNNPPARPQPPVDDSTITAKKKIGRRILLIEDHEPTRLALSQLLTRRNYQVTSATTVAGALALARQEKFDLVVSDLGLPDGDGYALMSELRDNFGLKGIALSGYGMEQDVARSKNAGFITHLVKPIRVESLEKALEESN